MFSLRSQYTVRMFPDGLITVDVVQYINGASEDSILNRTVSSVPLCSDLHLSPLPNCLNTPSGGHIYVAKETQLLSLY